LRKRESGHRRRGTGEEAGVGLCPIPSVAASTSSESLVLDPSHLLHLAIALDRGSNGLIAKGRAGTARRDELGRDPLAATPEAICAWAAA
jgi:hypothetical protein